MAEIIDKRDVKIGAHTFILMITQEQPTLFSLVMSTYREDAIVCTTRDLPGILRRIRAIETADSVEMKRELFTTLYELDSEDRRTINLAVILEDGRFTGLSSDFREFVGTEIAVIDIASHDLGGGISKVREFESVQNLDLEHVVSKFRSINRNYDDRLRAEMTMSPVGRF